LKLGRRRRKGKSARRLARTFIANIPAFLKLIVGLLRDRRVSGMDRAIFGFVLFYTLAPADLIPDFFWFLGLVDDVYLIGMALSRLVVRAGPDILLEHWSGDPHELGVLIEQVEDVGALLPQSIRGALARTVGSGPPT
jgi:uncharacterized membrane protein YkvA (DUF1232 family)